MTASALSSASRSTALLGLVGIVTGLAVGMLAPHLSDAAAAAREPMVMLLVTLLFLEMRPAGGRAALRSRRGLGVLALLVVCNFLLLPALAWGLSWLFLPAPGQEMVRLGVLIYLLFPCADWFLGFVRLAGGSTALGAALIPLHLGLQLALYPFWVSLATGGAVDGVLERLGPALVSMVLVPAGVAVVLRLVAARLPDAGGAALAAGLVSGAGRAVPAVLAGLLAVLLAGGSGQLVGALDVVAPALAAVVVFFAASAALLELVSRGLHLRHEETALLCVSGAARNAPLMLALTSATLGPDPVLAATIVLGMLLEFPHLVLLAGRLRRRRAVTLAA
ncbi:arsenic resistance protein [Nesterenkonia sp. F]|uniref:arsenic resistance protein n=1 Tax=Nesterenkonia sp. F TaxID=795955 RepID=UPI000255C9D5|nr:transporter [Nesterenkonia sp. F]